MEEVEDERALVAEQVVYRRAGREGHPGDARQFLKAVWALGCSAGLEGRNHEGENLRRWGD